MVTDQNVQYTLGPWSNQGRTYRTHNDPTRVWETCVFAHVGIVAIAKGVTDHESAANARLIAAAPDLLAALKQIREWLLGDRGDAPSEWAHPLFKRSYEMAEAAIAQAEGREA